MKRLPTITSSWRTVAKAITSVLHDAARRRHKIQRGAGHADQTHVLSLWSPRPRAGGSSILSLMLAATFPVVATTSSRERATVRATGIEPAFSAWETEVAQASRDAKVLSF